MTMASRAPPLVSSPRDLTIIEALDSETNAPKYMTFYHVTEEEELWFARFIPEAVLDKTLTMEAISRAPYPNFIGYHGCRVRRGRITALVLERLSKTLTQLVSSPDFWAAIDKDRLVDELQSAVDHLHSLGLAHNDINLDNIVFRDDGSYSPVLIDFGSCKPFGESLQSLGTEGWYEEFFTTSEKKHDIYSLKKLREWLQVQGATASTETAAEPNNASSAWKPTHAAVLLRSRKSEKM